MQNDTFNISIKGPSRQLSKPSAREKNQVQKNLDLHFTINISGNSPFGFPR
jgi:predicted ATP-binding protein involved in virulence